MNGYGYGGYSTPGGGGGPYVNGGAAGGAAGTDASGDGAFRGATPNSKYVSPDDMTLQKCS